jgi:hypothetical protein
MGFSGRIGAFLDLNRHTPRPPARCRHYRLSIKTASEMRRFFIAIFYIFHTLCYAPQADILYS